MQARLIAYPPDRAAIVRTLAADEALRLGRAADSDLQLDHPSVSRSHARLQRLEDGWWLHDLDSKNGSFIDGARSREARLDRACWLRFGDVYCEFSPLSQAQFTAERRGIQTRRAAATAHTARVESLVRLDDLLDGSLRAVLDLAQCERGFVLLDDGRPGRDGHYAVRTSLALDPARLGTREFSGSVGAVRRTLEQGQPVVANDIGDEAWLAQRASVVAAGLSALICLPLLDGGRAFGALYADRVRPGPPITTLDLELLQAFAEGAAVWIAARRTSELLDARAAQADWDGILAAHAGDLADAGAA